jgi:hypothetical protein
MMSKIFKLINDIDGYLLQNSGREIEIKPTEENHDGGIELKVKNNDHPRIGNNLSDFETPNFNSRAMKSSNFYKNMQAVNDQTEEDDDELLIEDDMRENPDIEAIGNNRMSSKLHNRNFTLGNQ